MVDIRIKHLEEQLKRIGCNYRFWGRAELRELAYVLLPGEKLEHCLNGTYDGGFALLAATDQRVLLIDKKPTHLTLDHVRFDMITDIRFSHRLLNANIQIWTPNKLVRFTAYNQARLRGFFQFAQTRVADIRQHYSLLQRAQASQRQGMIQTVMQRLAVPDAPADQAVPAGNITQTVQVGNDSRTIPVIGAYTRLPLLSRQRRFLGSRAMNSPQPSWYQ